jgi:hypothetical protein
VRTDIFRPLSPQASVGESIANMHNAPGWMKSADRFSFCMRERQRNQNEPNHGEKPVRVVPGAHGPFITRLFFIVFLSFFLGTGEYYSFSVYRQVY